MLRSDLTILEPEFVTFGPGTPARHVWNKNRDMKRNSNVIRICRCFSSCRIAARQSRRTSRYCRSREVFLHLSYIVRSLISIQVTIQMNLPPLSTACKSMLVTFEHLNGSTTAQGGVWKLELHGYSCRGQAGCIMVAI